MEMKQNHTFFHATYSILTSYLSLSKNIKIFQWHSKSKLLSFMTTVNPNNGIETKLDIFSWNIFKSGIIFIGHKILNHFNDFCKWHLSMSLQTWAQSNKWNEVKWDMYKPDSVFPYLVLGTLFKYWNFHSW